MEEHQRLQESELPNSEVRGPGGLHAFFSCDSNTNMSLINHGDIVSTISYTQSSLVRVGSLDHLNDICLLFWTDTTGENHVHFVCEHDQFRLNLLICVNNEQTFTSNYDCHFLLMCVFIDNFVLNA